MNYEQARALKNAVKKVEDTARLVEKLCARVEELENKMNQVLPEMTAEPRTRKARTVKRG